jgi:hypothetical protein
LLAHRYPARAVGQFPDKSFSATCGITALNEAAASGDKFSQVSGSHRWFFAILIKRGQGRSAFPKVSDETAVQPSPN